MYLYVLYAGQTTQMSPCASSTFTLASDIEPTPERPVRFCKMYLQSEYGSTVYVSTLWTSISKHKKLHRYISYISKVGMFGQARNFSIGADSVCLEFKALAIYFLLFPLLPDLDIS